MSTISTRIPTQLLHVSGHGTAAPRLEFIPEAEVLGSIDLGDPEIRWIRKIGMHTSRGAEICPARRMFRLRVRTLVDRRSLGHRGLKRINLGVLECSRAIDFLTEALDELNLLGRLRVFARNLRLANSLVDFLLKLIATLGSEKDRSHGADGRANESAFPERHQLAARSHSTTPKR